jgi:transaldolase
MSEGDAYDEQVRELAARGADVDEARARAHHHDVRCACDVLADVYDATDGVDGRVSIEVDPRLAHDTDATVAEARSLWWPVDRPNLFIKIPATDEGLPAITRRLAEGISVNVTLIFSSSATASDGRLPRGLEQAAAPATTCRIHSVASFFVSRVDTEIDKRLDKIGTDEALALRGKAAVANARLAYQRVREGLRPTAGALLAAKARHAAAPAVGVDRREGPGVRRHACTSRAGRRPDTVNTMPEKTLEAFADHGEVAATGHRLYDEARRCSTTRRGRHRLRRRVRGARARGRREVREVLERADRHGDGAAGRRPSDGRCPPPRTGASARSGRWTVPVELASATPRIAYADAARAAGRRRSPPARRQGRTRPCGARTPRRRPRIRLAGSTCRETSRPAGRRAARPSSCCASVASTGSCCAAWAARRSHPR